MGVVLGSIFPEKMSNLELLCAGFCATLGTNIVPGKNGAEVSIHELFQQTYVMRPPSSVRGASEFNVFVKDLKCDTITIKVTEKSTVDDMKTAIQDHTDTEWRDLTDIFWSTARGWSTGDQLWTTAR